jgi:N-acetyltransferase
MGLQSGPMSAFRLEPVCLEGSFTRLEPLELVHADALFEAGRDEEIWRYLLVPQPKTADEMEAWIGTALEARQTGRELPFATARKSDGKVVGTTRYLDVKPFERSVEIGWTWLSPEARRTAVNTESKLLLLEHAFGKLGCQRVQLKTDALNERSRRAIERIGAHFEGILRNFQRYWHGAIRDTAMYSITEGEWPAVREALRCKLAASPCDAP